MIVAGFGFREGADLASLVDALTLAQAGNPSVRALATLLDKVPLVERLAGLLGVPFLAFGTESMAAMPTITRSPISFASRGTGSVAEAVALVAAGPGARLLSPRHISPDRMATCALAQGVSQ
ncbi:MAG TPA: cobalamin biosynthesis protein [Sphingobium sp.]|uniref:cobalamin biosynthesis protein n=1 Tax=Sphingobium sp. TaxID=1912891 RepID=UPI002ED5FA9A